MVVAIIGILAAIAVPEYLRFQLKTKTAEGRMNLASIRTAEQSYMAEFGQYIAAVPTPAGSVGTTRRDWPYSGADGFDIIGWAPESSVLFQYAVATAADGFTATAVSDIDGDGVRQAWGISVKTSGGARVASAHPDCDELHLRMDGEVGPCDALSGAVFGSMVF